MLNDTMEAFLKKRHPDFVPLLKLQQAISEKRLTANQVIEVSNVSQRGLNYWEYRGAFGPGKEKGKWRRYSISQAICIYALDDLRRNGADWVYVRDIFPWLQFIIENDVKFLIHVSLGKGVICLINFIADPEIYYLPSQKNKLLSRIVNATHSVATVPIAKMARTVLTKINVEDYFQARTDEKDQLVYTIMCEDIKLKQLPESVLSELQEK